MNHYSSVFLYSKKIEYYFEIMKSCIKNIECYIEIFKSYIENIKSCIQKKLNIILKK